ncbi:hypothetical protein [Breoghania sp.]|uniref:hypothetical protein n=1 Tax=Breoghania sp. TaxID=2065378 RepID=UPI00263524AB|nr:hypothetical protein [Breoghania sp.]MDJ0931597.1 hypothetical protein [Breoghania sp.]
MVESIYQKRYALTNVKKFSFTDNNAEWKARRQAANEQFYAQQEATTSLFSTGVSAAAGQVELTTQLVQSRLQAEMNARPSWTSSIPA